MREWLETKDQFVESLLKSFMQHDEIESKIKKKLLLNTTSANKQTNERTK